MINTLMILIISFFITVIFLVYKFFQDFNFQKEKQRIRYELNKKQTTKNKISIKENSIKKISVKENNYISNNTEYDNTYYYMPYMKNHSFLTFNEYKFYLSLKQYITKNNLDYIIIPRANLKEFITVTEKKHYRAYFNKIRSKHVDFLVCTQNFKPIMAFELDDHSHYRNDRIKRDKFVDELFKEIQLILIHFKSEKYYSPNIFNGLLISNQNNIKTQL